MDYKDVGVTTASRIDLVLDNWVLAIIDNMTESEGNVWERSHVIQELIIRGLEVKKEQPSFEGVNEILKSHKVLLDCLDKRTWTQEINYRNLTVNLTSEIEDLRTLLEKQGEMIEGFGEAIKGLRQDWVMRNQREKEMSDKMRQVLKEMGPDTKKIVERYEAEESKLENFNCMLDLVKKNTEEKIKKILR